MELAYETMALRRLCESSRTAKKKLGEQSAASLHTFLFDISSAGSIGDLPPIYGELSKLHICKDEITVSFDGLTILLMNNHRDNNNNSCDCRRIKLISISLEGEHDE
jgi:hypothetical protein